jgi:hypothetical protein
MTNFASLSWLIKEYNGKHDSTETAQFALDDECVHIRDALVHGRLVAPLKDYPLTLWKFDQVKAGRVPIEFNKMLTTDWLDTKPGK